MDENSSPKYFSATSTRRRPPVTFLSKIEATSSEFNANSNALYAIG
jgi:hypothetical protein